MLEITRKPVSYQAIHYVEDPNKIAPLCFGVGTVTGNTQLKVTTPSGVVNVPVNSFIVNEPDGVWVYSEAEFSDQFDIITEY
jgi:hypothetical protein